LIEWENKEEYLSGNIYAKLQIAKNNGIERNILALKAARPLPLLPNTNHETIFKCLEKLEFNWNELDSASQDKLLSQHLKAELGASFITTKFYEQFALEVMGIKVKINYFSSQSSSGYKVNGSSKDLEKYGTPHRDSSKILNYALNNQDPIISIYHNEEYNKAASDEATIIARGKVEALKLAWNQWVWSSESRCIEIATYFNTHVNVFTPKPGRYSVYNYLKDFLIALGIPQSQVTFIHDWNKNKRKELYRLVDEGKIRIVIANTHKGGVGVNIHRRGLIAAHQIQCPWRERDVTQQEGRLIRQGNGSILGTTLKRCYIFRYVTERLDAFRWQTIAYKQKMTWQFMNGEEINELEDINKVVLDFQQISLMATGNSLLQEKAQLQDEAAKLQILKVSHDRTQLQIKSQIKDYEREISGERTRLKQLSQISNGYTN
jgi:hypothetical protein